MDNPLKMYQDFVREQPLCTEQVFADALARYRAGDEAAARTISGSCLGLAMQIAEKHAKACPGHDLLDLIQDANGGLMDAIKTFAGHSLQDFLQHMEETIHHHLAMVA